MTTKNDNVNDNEKYYGNDNDNNNDNDNDNNNDNDNDNNNDKDNDNDNRGGSALEASALAVSSPIPCWENCALSK